ncbi:MAG: PilZ domain-containing protein [Gammaproteobacteria bacterium]|nr:PilZ domain-containing protein [Gammaproteobacteria bacterium]
MSYKQRDYRTHLSTKALVFLDEEEVDCTIIDLSISGAKFEIIPGVHLKNALLISEVVDTNDVINFAIPEMHIDGEVKIIRKEQVDDKVYLSVLFSDIFYGLEHLPYRRKVYRTRCRSNGQITLNGQSYEFISQNLSVKGMMIAVYEPLEIKDTDEFSLDFKHFNIHGKARCIWSKRENNKNMMGIEYTQLNKPIDGLASFSRQ